MHDDFGIAARMKNMAERLQLGNQFLEVVDLAIENHGNRAIFIEQRLLTRRQIDDRQTAMTETETGLDVLATFIRTAMELALIHALDQLCRHIAPAAHVEYSYDSTHWFVISQY